MNETRVRRVLSTGWLELVMPLLHWDKQRYQKKMNGNINTENKENEKQFQTQTLEPVSLNIVKNNNSNQKEIQLKEVTNESNDNEIMKNFEIDFDESEVPPLE